MVFNTFLDHIKESLPMERGVNRTFDALARSLVSREPPFLPFPCSLTLPLHTTIAWHSLAQVGSFGFGRRSSLCLHYDLL